MCGFREELSLGATVISQKRRQERKEERQWEALLGSIKFCGIMRLSKNCKSELATLLYSHPAWTFKLTICCKFFFHFFFLLPLEPCIFCLKRQRRWYKRRKLCVCVCVCVCVFKWRKHLRISIKIYERFLTGTQVRVWGLKIGFNVSFLFGRFLRNGGTHEHYFTEVCIGSKYLALL